MPTPGIFRVKGHHRDNKLTQVNHVRIPLAAEISIGKSSSPCRFRRHLMGVSEFGLGRLVLAENVAGYVDSEFLSSIVQLTYVRAKRACSWRCTEEHGALEKGRPAKHPLPSATEFRGVCRYIFIEYRQSCYCRLGVRCESE